MMPVLLFAANIHHRSRDLLLGFTTKAHLLAYAHNSYWTAIAVIYCGLCRISLRDSESNVPYKHLFSIVKCYIPDFNMLTYTDSALFACIPR